MTERCNASSPGGFRALCGLVKGHGGDHQHRPTGLNWPATKPRATYLQLSDVRLLDMWGRELHDMWGYTAYLVGSALVRPDYRDVDVRIVLPDDVVEQLAEVMDLGRLHVALSLWGQRATGLPIDCQVQAASAADSEPAHLIRPIGRIPGRLDGRAWPTAEAEEPGS